MSWIILVILIILLAIMASKRSTPDDQINRMSYSYRQGYWDGVRAAELGEVHSPEYQTSTVTTDVTLESSDASSQGVETGNDNGDIYEGAYIPQQSYPAATMVASPPVTKSDSHAVINIALYVATLLLVSGILLLSQAFGMPAGVRFVLILAMIAAYFGVGLLLERTVPLVKPAAVAFVGTALASIPIAGISMYLLVTHNAALCWLVTSLIGIVMYTYATLHFKNQFLGYISILSMFTLSCILPALANAHIVWYYVVMIVFGALMTFIADQKNLGLPQELSRPITMTSPIFVPLALVGSVISMFGMSALEYSAVLLASIIYYTVDALTTDNPIRQTLAHIAARFLSIIAAGTIASWASDGLLAVIATTVFIIAFLHVVVSLIFIKPRERRASAHEIMLWVGLAVALLIAPTLLMFEPSGSHKWIVVAEFVSTAVLSIIAALRTRRYELFWSLVYVSLVLPLFIGRQIMQPPVTEETYFMIAATYILVWLVAQIVLRQRQMGANGRALMYGTLVLWLTMSMVPALALAGWWLAAWLAIVAIVCYVVASAERAMVLVAIGHGFVLFVLAQSFAVVHMSLGWSLVALTVVSLMMTLVTYEIARVGHGELTRRLVEPSEVITILYPSVIGSIALICGYSGAITAVQQLAAFVPMLLALYYMTYRLRSIALLVMANITGVLAELIVCRIANLSEGQALAATAWFGMVVFYVGSRVVKRNHPRASVVLMVSAMMTTLFAGGIGIFVGSATMMTVSGTALVFAGAALCYEAYVSRQIVLLDIGAIVVMAALQRIIAIVAPEVHYLIYTHLWALLALVLALVYYHYHHRNGGVARLVIALVMISAPGVMAAFGEGGVYQIVFLVEHVAIVLVGLAKSHKLSAIWGAVGVTFAILYMLRGFQALMNIVIGLLVIGAVIYVIWRTSKKEGSSNDPTTTK